MKRIVHLFTLLVASISLNGCSLFDFIAPGSALESSEDSSSISGDGTAATETIHHGGSWQYNDTHHWKICEECGEQYDYGEHELQITSTEGDVNHYECACGYTYEEVDDTPTYSLTINSSSFYNYGSYETGNYGSKTVSGWGFEYYRIIESYGYCFAIKPNFTNGDSTLAGAFLNTSSSGPIKTLSITYTANGNFNVKYGNDAKRSLSAGLASSSTRATTNISLAKNRYFSIESDSADVNIYSIEIVYYEGTSSTLENVEPNTKDYRIAPTTYVGDLVDGESSVSVPTSIKVSGNSYTVLATKTYTYYSFNYVRNNSEYVEDATMLSKVDVANYYLAFHTLPANYATSSNKSTVRAIFGEDTRMASYYDRDDGYATAVPFNGNPPSYYELDIGLDGADYSVSGSRGTGRIVVWEQGFSCYGNDMVAIYTDDHYATFQEYLNYGSFGDRFNAERMRVSHAFNSAITLGA